MHSPQPHPLRAAARILLLAVGVLILFSVTAVICALPLRWFEDRVHASAGIALLGIICGLIAWLFFALFHMRRDSLTFLNDSHETAALRLRRELEELGYEAGETSRGCTVFKPGFSAYLVGGSVRMTEQAESAVVSGPKVFIEILRKRLKVLHHLASVQQSIQETRARQGQHLLRRVEIDLRVSAPQWQKIYDDVISVLDTPNVDLVCEVHILAQNESGILETTVESGIRERLRKLNIPAEIRKDGRPAAELKLAEVGVL
jgi:hypothetical protein